MPLLAPLTHWIASAFAGLATSLGFSEPTASQLPGYAEADFVLVGPELAGRLVALEVDRGGRVALGDVLFRQDDTADRAAVAQAQAQLAAARSQLANLLTGKRPAEVAVVEAQLHEAEAQAHLAQRQLERRARLAETKTASLQDLDIAQADLDAAKARVGSLSAQVVVAHLPARPDEVRAAEAQVAASQAALDQATWRLSQRRITAPVAAQIDDILHRPGEEVPAGGAVLSLLPPGNIKVRFYVPETLISSLHLGQPVGFACDGCAPALKGHIAFIASAAEYTPPVIYSVGHREKLQFLIEARPDTAPESLHPGQPVDVTLR